MGPNKRGRKGGVKDQLKGDKGFKNKLQGRSTLHDQRIVERVDSFCYLGSIISNRGEWTRTLKTELRKQRGHLPNAYALTHHVVTLICIHFTNGVQTKRYKYCKILL